MTRIALRLSNSYGGVFHQDGADALGRFVVRVFAAPCLEGVLVWSVLEAAAPRRPEHDLVLLIGGDGCGECAERAAESF
jgi:hypothetical protein